MAHVLGEAICAPIGWHGEGTNANVDVGAPVCRAPSLLCQRRSYNGPSSSRVLLRSHGRTDWRHHVWHSAKVKETLHKQLGLDPS